MKRSVNGMITKTGEIVLNERTDYLDVVCGLMIIWMMIGHMISNCDLKDTSFYIIGNRLFPFFMPWFFFKSGMFYKERTNKDVAKQGVAKLLTPWIVFSVISVLLLSWPRIIEVGILDCTKETIKSFIVLGTPSQNVSLWFLLTLFFVKLISNFFVIKGIKPFFLLLLSLLLALLFFFLRRYSEESPILRYPEYLYNTITGICFFSAGFVLKERQFSKTIVLISLFIHAFIIVILFSFVDMEHNTLVVGYYSLWILSSMTGVILTNNLFRYLCEKKSFHILQYIGKNSIVFYVTHFIIIKLVILYISPLLPLLSNWALFLVMFGLCVIIIPIMNTLINNSSFCWVIGRSKRTGDHG